jgi:hypothetical protein
MGACARRGRRVGGYYVLHLLLLECATPFRCARWLGRALQAEAARVDRDSADGSGSNEGTGGGALLAGAASLELVVYLAGGVLLAPPLLDAAAHDFPTALGGAWTEAIEGADAGTGNRTYVLAALCAGLCGQTLCLAIEVCKCALDLAGYLRRLYSSTDAKKSD